MSVRNSQTQKNTGTCGNVKRKHMDHIAEKGYVVSFHYGLVHKSVSIQEGMKIPDAKAAVDKEWNKLKNIPAWDVKKARSQAEVIIHAKMDGKTVHFANLMDICNLKNAELAKHLQKNKARIVLRDNLKFGSGILHDKDQKVGIRLTILCFCLKGIYTVTH